MTTCSRNDDSSIYKYHMDPLYVHRENVSFDSDPSVFGRSGLSSGCADSCDHQDINEFRSSPRCTPAWSNIVSVGDRTSVTEMDLTRYTMIPNAWSTGYRGIDVDGFLPMRMLQAMAANQKAKSCKNPRVPNSYGSYGV